MSYSKNYICKFMQTNSWHHKLFHFHLSFWIWNVWKGKENIATYLLILIEPLFHDFCRWPFMAVFSAFFHLDRSCTILGVIFHKQRSSVTDSFHDLHGLPLPWQPDTSIWVQHFIQSSLLATCPYHLSHLRRFILNLDSNGWRLNREYKSCRLKSSSALTLHI